ncbi:Peptidase, M16 family [Labilithrix luteola]|uniref:Peptidase, M16 family n=1 Tax=Labilithrix luteola TaxID=1391654 RepID=A0A0K1Q1D6_9BACT|nr:pitrilysin family protein [Labilithrix luteola]AKU99552.1 Peptidase, M16 family [Labilithrix luteola]
MRDVTRDRREQSGERPFRIKTLSNGLRVVVAPQPQLHRAHVALYVRVGSRFETVQTNGLSHFLEHMLYRGTPRLKTAHEVNHAFESLGGYLYAATQTDFGVFSVTLPPESLGEASQLFGEVLAEPTFADIELEKEIVCEEILEDLDDEGRQVDADNLSRQLIYPTHPLGFTITGDEERVRSFDHTMLRAHHARHYATASSVLAFSGNIDPDQALELAEKCFGHLLPGDVVHTDAPLHEQAKARIQIVENVSSQTELRVCFRAVSERSTHRAAMDMLMRILDDGMSTRLYHRICDSKGLCYDVSAAFDGYEDDGVLDFAAGVQHARSSVITKEILELLRDLGKLGPSDTELAKARHRNAWEMRSMLDSPEDLAGFYAGGLLFDRFETPEARVASNRAVTSEEIRDLAAMLAQPERLNVLAVGLLEDGEDERLEDVVHGFTGV